MRKYFIILSILLVLCTVAQAIKTKITEVADSWVEGTIEGIPIL